jgi:serine/threonine-protein kinase
MTAPAVDRRLGTILQGRYRIVERIAHGGMGIVYKAERLQLERAVAVKFLHPWIASDESARRRFEIEMKAMSRLTNPHCVSVIDFGVDESPYLVMDFVVGRTLRDLLGDGPVPAGRALHIARQILAGLAHAHSAGIIHRDVKPENVVLAESTGFGDQVRILDFGLAKLVGSGSNPTTGLPLGTPHYMSPEQTRAEPLDARTDLYAVGILLYEMLEGRRPFNADEVYAIIRMQRDDPPPPMAANVSAELKAVVARALEKAPTARYYSAKEMAAALDAAPEAAQRPQQPGAIFVSAAGAAAPAPARLSAETPAPSAAPAASSRFYWLLGVVGLGAVALALGAIALRGGGATSPPAPPTAKAERPAEPEPEIEVGEPTPVPRQPAKKPPAPTAAPGAGADPLAAFRSMPRQAAINALTDYRKEHPKDAQAALLLGHLYLDKLWWTDGIKSYRAAISLDPSLRSDETMIRELLKGLVSDGSHWKVADFLADEIGEPALPYVRESAALVKNKQIKARAQRLLQRMEK